MSAAPAPFLPQAGQLPSHEVVSCFSFCRWLRNEESTSPFKSHRRTNTPVWQRKTLGASSLSFERFRMAPWNCLDVQPCEESRNLWDTKRIANFRHRYRHIFSVRCYPDSYPLCSSRKVPSKNLRLPIPSPNNSRLGRWPPSARRLLLPILKFSTFTHQI